MHAVNLSQVALLYISSYISTVDMHIALWDPHFPASICVCDDGRDPEEQQKQSFHGISI